MISKPLNLFKPCDPPRFSASMSCLAKTFPSACKDAKLKTGSALNPLSRVHAGKSNARAHKHEPHLQPDETSRRHFILRSVNVAVLAEAALNQSDPRTVVNSLLGAYGLPQLKSTPGFRTFDDPEKDFLLEYPKSWVGRANRQRLGLSVSDFNSSDKLIVEIFPEPEQQDDRVRSILEHLISPGQDVGGDSRLLIPSNKNVVTAEEQIAGQTYMYLRFPSETITRSGYQIKRKNLAVAATLKGMVYCCVASARSDQYDKSKEALLTHVVESFRVRQM